jgi:hypothetical protein
MKRLLSGGIKRPLLVAIELPFILIAADILSTLSCLNHLTHEEAEDAGKVRQYAVMTQERLHAFAKLIGPILWIPKPAAI